MNDPKKQPSAKHWGILCGACLGVFTMSTPSASAQLQSKDSPSARIDPSTLTGKVMCGYQGWFGTPGDGQGLGWRHYNSQKTGKFEPGHVGIEFWPDMSEFSPRERFNTPFRHADGRTAQVFSSAMRDTVVRHFKWMKEYGIDGVFVQRFATEVTAGNNAPRNRKRKPSTGSSTTAAPVPSSTGGLMP
jgi:hypothetical protein